MIQLIEPPRGVALDDYQAVANLSGSVRDLRREAARLAPQLKGRGVWMLNSSAHGGGVAELMPPLVACLRELGVEAQWLVMQAATPAFFQLTKRLHNLIHGHGDPAL